MARWRRRWRRRRVTLMPSTLVIVASLSSLLIIYCWVCSCKTVWICCTRLINVWMNCRLALRRRRMNRQWVLWSSVIGWRILDRIWLVGRGMIMNRHGIGLWMMLLKISGWRLSWCLSLWRIVTGIDLLRFLFAGILLQIYPIWTIFAIFS